MAATGPDTKPWPRAMVYYDTIMDPRLQAPVLEAMQMWVTGTPIQFFGGGWFGQEITPGTNPQPYVGSPIACMLHDIENEPAVYYIDYTNTIYEMCWWGGAWNLTNLQYVSSGPPAAPNSSLTCVMHQVQYHAAPAPNELYPNVYYVAVIEGENKVLEMCYEGNGVWVNNYVSSNAAPALPGTALASMYVGTPSAETHHQVSPRVYYINSDYHVCELAWLDDNWHYRDLCADAIGGALPAGSAGALACTAHDSNLDPNVYYVAAVDNNGTIEYHVCELGYASDHNWYFTDLTERSGGLSVSAQTPLTCGIHSSNYDPVVYNLGTDNHVYELEWWGGEWHFTDLTQKTGTKPANCNSLTMVPHNSNFDPNVYYIDDTNSLCELSWWDDAWHSTNVSMAAGGFDCWAPTSLASASRNYAGGGYEPMVFFMSDPGTLDEVSWSAQNTVSSGGPPRPANNETKGFVRFIPGSSNNTNLIGYTTSVTIVQINPNAPHACHELGHVLGLIHEHCRDDRHTYVTVKWDNIQSGEEINYKKVDDSNNLTRYDYQSTMHYSHGMFENSNGNSTMIANPPYEYQTYIMGNDLGGPPTPTDYEGINTFYPSADKGKPQGS